jgi:hypothetical protein
MRVAKIPARFDSIRVDIASSFFFRLMQTHSVFMTALQSALLTLSPPGEGEELLIKKLNAFVLLDQPRLLGLIGLSQQMISQ